jgi:eukaryotic-like serine/threonine-protein kinase
MSVEMDRIGLPAYAPSIWRFGSAELNEVWQELRVREARMRVTPEALLVLRCLLRAAGRDVGKAELVRAVWGERSPASVPDGAISRCMRDLRRALAENKHLLVTARGQGWRVECDGVVCEQADVPAQPTPGLSRGLPAPGGSGHVLERLLGGSQGIQTWEASGGPGAPPRIFKVAVSELGRAFMKEALLRQLQLQEASTDRGRIVRVHDWNLLTAPSYVVCEHAGQDLARWMAGKDGLSGMPLLARLRLFIDIAETVAAAHDAGVLHRDLKPENIWIVREEHGCRVMVDFCTPWPGDADLCDPEPAEPGWHHLAPELRGGRPATQRSEVYALGALLCRLASGDPGRTLDPGWSLDIDKDLGMLIVAATEPDPAWRTASVEELIRHLRELYPPLARSKVTGGLAAFPGVPEALAGEPASEKILRFRR